MMEGAGRGIGGGGPHFSPRGNSGRGSHASFGLGEPLPIPPNHCETTFPGKLDSTPNNLETNETLTIYQRRSDAYTADERVTSTGYVSHKAGYLTDEISENLNEHQILRRDSQSHHVESFRNDCRRRFQFGRPEAWKEELDTAPSWFYGSGRDNTSDINGPDLNIAVSLIVDEPDPLELEPDYSSDDTLSLDSQGSQNTGNEYSYEVNSSTRNSLRIDPDHKRLSINLSDTASVLSRDSGYTSSPSHARNLVNPETDSEGVGTARTSTETGHTPVPQHQESIVPINLNDHPPIEPASENSFNSREKLVSDDDVPQINDDDETLNNAEDTLRSVNITNNTGDDPTTTKGQPPKEEEPPPLLGFMDLFGVQLEVTNRLLDAERRKLVVFQKELTHERTHERTHGRGDSARSLHFRQVAQLKVNVSHIQQQYDQLEREYEEACRGLLNKSAKIRKSCRSQPAIGLKQTPKTRPTIFGTVAAEPVTSDTKKGRTVSAPQMCQGSGGGGAAMSTANGSLENGLDDHKPDDKALVYQDGNLLSGTLDALIQHLVPTSDYKPERTYIFAFLLSSRLFIRPHMLMNQMCQTCIYQQNLMSDKLSRDTLGRFGPHLIQLLGEWTDNFPYDFRDERMMRCLKDITQRIVNLYPELRKDVGLLMHNLFTKLSGLQKYEELLTRINGEVAQRLLNIMPTTDIYEVCPGSLVLAQQMTHIELERLSMIGPEEFVQAFCKESSDKESASIKDLKKTNNLESYVHWFNRLSYFVATEICMHLKKKNRVRLIEYFIDVAKECINIGNFNSLMAIIAGLNMSPIQRLKKTWEKVNKEKFEILEHQMNPTSNFGSYRSSLKAALWRSNGAHDDREKIVIPFFSLFVKDMYFLNEGCHNKLENGQVNFNKFWQLAKQISEFITWKQVECPFDRHPPVLNYLLTNPVFSENSLSLASFECESPENSYERSRYKQLKEQAGL